MMRDMTMWCAWRFVGSSVRRSFAPIVGHDAARARFARMLKPVCHAARFCAAFCGIAEPAPRCFPDYVFVSGYLD